MCESIGGVNLPEREMVCKRISEEYAKLENLTHKEAYRQIIGAMLLQDSNGDETRVLDTLVEALEVVDEAVPQETFDANHMDVDDVEFAGMSAEVADDNDDEKDDEVETIPFGVDDGDGSCNDGGSS